MQQTRQYRTKNLYFSKRMNMVLNKILEYPLTIIEAPMGYGKTTAAREYAKRAGATLLQHRVYDNSIDSFWDGFAKLFHDLDEDECRGLLELGFPNDAGSTQKAITLI